MIRPGDYLNNDPFIVKMLLIAIGLCNGAVFAALQSHRLRKITIIVSSVIWVTAVYHGRWIAFFSEV
jgi:hypothetical protein